MEEKIHILTKQEIGEAIVNYIGTYRERQSFFPYYISDTDQELNIPESVMFHLDFTPKGTRIADVKHKI